ncbi:MAG: hypothetical protein WC462_05115 [archaeon]
MAKLSTNQLLGIILLIAIALPFIPVINSLADIGRIAIFLVALFLLIKG